MDFPYTFEQLNDKLNICVSPDHKFGTDAFLLASFAAPRRKDICCDLGTGCGIIPMLWCRHDAPHTIYAVDIQDKAIQQLGITIDRCALHGKIIPLLADLKALPSELTPGGFDLVTCNPPYKVSGAGIKSVLESELIARHEILCTIDDVVKAAERLLKFGGRLCICNRPERLCDVLTSMRANGIEPKLLRMVQQRGDTAPWLFLVEGKKGSKPFMRIDKPLIIEGEGGFSRELLDIYGKADNLSVKKQED